MNGPSPSRSARPRPRRALAGLAAVVAAALLAACAGTSAQDVSTEATTRAAARDGGGSGGDGGGTASGPGSAARRTTTTERPATGSGATVTMAFAGDSSFQNLDGALARDPQSLLSGIAPLLSGADLAVVNLEAALGTTGSPQGKTFTFRAPPAALDALKAAGVDAVTMANNHGMDYGATGLADSLAIEQRTGFPIIGVGADDAQAYEPLVVEAQGQRIGVIAASDVFDDALRASWTAGPSQPGVASAEEDHQERLAQQVRDTRPDVDTLVVFLHYGTEKQTCPNPRQQELARMLLDAGADVVVGGHAHRVQGAGYLGDKVVAYGLGNFIFQANSPEGAASGVLLVRATGRRIDGFEWKPAVIRGSVPSPLTGAAEQQALSTMAQRRACAGLTDAPTAPATGGATASGGAATSTAPPTSAAATRSRG